MRAICYEFHMVILPYEIKHTVLHALLIHRVTNVKSVSGSTVAVETEFFIWVTRLLTVPFVYIYI